MSILIAFAIIVSIPIIGYLLSDKTNLDSEVDELISEL